MCMRMIVGGFVRIRLDRCADWTVRLLDFFVFFWGFFKICGHLRSAFYLCWYGFQI